jgi:diadenosine tetraphosphate (Ap4A) HIT family hydrolase
MVREGMGSGKSVEHLHYHFIPNVRFGSWFNPCSSGCLPTGSGFAHLRTIDRQRALSG